MQQGLNYQRQQSHGGYAQVDQGQINHYLEDETTFYADTIYWLVHHEVCGQNQITLPRIKIEFPKFSDKNFKHWLYKVW